MDKDKLFEIFMEHGASAIAAYYDGNLEQFLVSREMKGGDDLGDFEDDEFRGDDDTWEALESLSLIFNSEELRKLGVRLGYNNDPWAAYMYARHVIEGRWSEVEDTIKHRPECAWSYIENIIGGRWPEGEEAIKQDPHHAYLYARDIIRGRWPEGEEAIRKDPYYWRRYQEILNNG